MRRKLSFVHLLLGLSLSLSACATDFPDTYSAEAIEATVVDADSHKPLAGVIVTANWALSSGNPGGSTPAGQLKVLETTTDKDGVFRFPGWGPIKRKQGFLLYDDPQLLLFKSGYDYRRLNNYRDGVALEGLWRAPVRTSQWDGKTIELNKLDDANTQYKSLLDFSSEVDHFATSHADPCQWMNLPAAIRTIMLERKKFEAQGVKSDWVRTFDKRLLDSKQYFLKKCGTAGKELLDEATK
jgi:hypothetical protein